MRISLSLKNERQRPWNDSVAIQARMGLSAAYLTSRQYARAYVRARQGLDMISRLAKTSDKSSEIARALEAPMYVYLGLSAVAVKQYGEAIEHFIAAEAAETLALSLMASQFPSQHSHSLDATMTRGQQLIRSWSDTKRSLRLRGHLTRKWL